jgi:hypothetical protein
MTWEDDYDPALAVGCGSNSNPNVSGCSNYGTSMYSFLAGEYQLEMTERGFNNFVVQGCLGATAAGLTHTPSSCIAYNANTRATEIGSITYPNSSTCWVAMDPMRSGSNAGLPNFARVAGTHYLIDCVDTSKPSMPTNAQLLMKVTTAGGAVTAVTDLRATLTGSNGSIIGSYSGPIQLTGNSVGGTDYISGANGIYNPRANGAKCDGTTDDAAAFNAAVTAIPAPGGTLWIPPSTNGCALGSTVTLRSNIRVTGAGLASKLVYANSSVSAPMLYWPSGSTNLKADNIYLAGPQPAGGVTGTGTSVARTTAYNATNGQEGILCINCTNFDFNHVTISNMGYQGITIVDSQHGQIAFGDFEHNVSGGVQVQNYANDPVIANSSDITINGNTASNNGSATAQGDGISLGAALLAPTATSGTGTISAVTAVTGSTITGVGTAFTSQLSIGDQIICNDGTNGQSGRVVTAIASDTSLTVYPTFGGTQCSAGSSFTFLHNQPILQWGQYGIVISSNRTFNNSLTGIEVHGVNTCRTFPYSISDVVVENNIAANNGYWGINDQMALHTSIIGNQVYGNGVLPTATSMYGINLQGVSDAAVLGNNIHDGGQPASVIGYGIIIQEVNTVCGTASVRVLGNTARNNGKNAASADIKVSSPTLSFELTNIALAYNDVTGSTTTNGVIATGFTQSWTNVSSTVDITGQTANGGVFAPRYYNSGTNPASVGLLRDVNAATSISARNAANSANINEIGTDASNNIVLGDPTNAASLTAQNPLIPKTFTFATIGTNLTTNGQIGYCSDCTIANPCAGGGTGAIAKRLNAINVCN